MEDCIDFGLVVFLIIELWWSGIVEDIFWFVLILDGEYIILVFLNKLDVGGRYGLCFIILFILLYMVDDFKFIGFIDLLSFVGSLLLLYLYVYFL